MKRLTIVLFLLALAPYAWGQGTVLRAPFYIAPTQAGIIVGTSWKRVFVGAGTTDTMNITVAAENYLVVAGATYNTAYCIPDSVKIGTTKLTKLINKNASVSSRWVWIFGTLSPPTGSQKITVYQPASPNSISWGATLFSGVNASTPTGAADTTVSTNSSSPAFSLTTGATDLAVALLTTRDTTITWTAQGPGQTVRWEKLAPFRTDEKAGLITLPSQGATSSFSTTMSGANWWGYLGVALKP